MALACPGCGVRLDPPIAAGPFDCVQCGSALYLEAGSGIPHRLVLARATEEEIRKAAADWLSRAGRDARTGALTLYYLPYFVLEPGAEGGTARDWFGRAAFRPGAEILARIPMYGARTIGYDEARAGAGATMVVPTVRAADVAGPAGAAGPAGEARVVELRHVPIASVAAEDGYDPATLWVEADRCRVLTPAAASARAGSRPELLTGLLVGVAVAAALACALLPLPLGPIGAALAAGVGWWRLRRALDPAPAIRARQRSDP